MPAGKLIMTSKRKRDDNADRRVKRQRIRKRSRSEPLMNDSENSEKRQALKRLFGRICSVEFENTLPFSVNQTPDDDNEYFRYRNEDDENDDPLLDSVPVDMDPEQLGFLVCAQETLRFLHMRGIPVQHPVFARLRSRLLQGIGELATA
ncbi:insensible [Anticarsia gemmatalis]|uniref:insensible n=1 Tax=Anticarsia gemmatalis TaxID=129554 RepID=UPI003F75855B